ncbi:hypothetical protein P5V15_006465 [Pogonomyrmex californicus]
MQEEPKNTTKLGSTRKVRNAGTLDVTLSSFVTSGTSRRTISSNMPGDVSQIQKVPRKKIPVSRQSIMPLQLNSQKKIDTECKELELGLLYDEYLQTVMMDLIMKKKTEEKKCLMIRQLATVAQEIDQDTRKLIKIKTRERDIMNLSLAQKETDAQLIAITKCTDDETFKAVQDMLFKLRFLLEPLDILQCNGIILPETQAEWKETREVLIKCSNALKSIANLIGTKGEIYCSVNTGLKNFTETYNEIENLQKKLKEALCNLQVLILKNASFSLACDNTLE